MSAPDTSAEIVARFLRANHYNETLEAFIQEAGLAEDAGSLKPGSWTIEQILQEKLQFDTSVNFEKQGGDGKQGWTTPAPDMAHEPQVGISSNVLCVSGDLQTNAVSVTSADRRWKHFSARAPFLVDDSVTRLSDSPILSTVFVPGGLVLTSSMSGHLTLRRSSTYSLVDTCRHHHKYAVQVVSHRQDEHWFIATAGWDQKINIYAPDILQLECTPTDNENSDTPSCPGFLGEPIHTILFTSNPESLVFACHPDTGDLYLIASRRDSTHLHYYQVVYEAGKVLLYEAGRQNLAPHSNAWVAFTPCSLALCPTDPTLIAVATSHLPHMKVIIARLLFPNNKTDQFAVPSEQRTQALMARAELALQDREDAAIYIQVSTMAPQTPYSTPQVVWRPDGSGLFVNGDDGVIRGVEATTGKVVCLLKGHEAGSKVRTLWAGLVNKQNNAPGQEILVSGGFDKKLLVWTAAAAPE